MNALKEPALIALNIPEAKRLVETARRRQSAMNQGRAIFSCSVSSGVPAQGPCPIHLECVRMAYSWKRDATWQARAWDADGSLHCDTVCDGHWIEAGGRRWHINFLDESDRAGFDEEAAQHRRNEGIIELSRLLWCREACTNHLFLSSLLANDRLTGLSRDLLYRDSETGELVYRMRQFEGGSQVFRFTPWDWLRWRWIHFFRPQFTFDQLFGIPKTPLIGDTHLYFDATHLHPLRTTHWHDEPKFGPRTEASEQWSAPIRLASGFYVSRVYESHAGLYSDNLQYRLEILDEDFHLDESEPVDIRPVNMTLPKVDW